MATDSKHEHVMHLGMNDNILFQGTTFHVQTEDSGITNPFITTHVFIGGNILLTKKTSYEDIVKSDSLEVIVRSIMDDQHKKVIVAIKRGRIDKTGFIKRTAASTKAAPQKTETPVTETPVTTQAPAPEPKAEQPAEKTNNETKEKDTPQIGAPGTSDKSFDDIILENLSLDKK